MAVKILVKDVFARRLFTLRRKSGMSQTALAKRVGVSTSTVSRWEDGVMLPSNEDIQTISEIFGKEPDYFLVEDTPKGLMFGSARVVWPSLKRIAELLKRIDDEETARLALDALEKVLADSPSENLAARKRDLSRVPPDILAALASAGDGEFGAIRKGIELARLGSAHGAESAKALLNKGAKRKKTADE